MKKIFKMFFYSLCLCTMMVGCESPIEEVPQPEPEPTKYFVSVGTFDTFREYVAAGYNVDLTVVCHEYNDNNELLNVEYWNVGIGGGMKTFTANKRATKVVIRLDTDVSYGTQSAEINLYVATVFYLEPENTISIYVSEHSPSSDYNPI